MHTPQLGQLAEGRSRLLRADEADADQPPEPAPAKPQKWLVAPNSVQRGFFKGMNMKYRIRARWVAVPTLAAVVAVATTAATRPSDAGAFAAENRDAMSRMMKGMDVPPSGHIDRDFAIMMIPHHQGAIDMARAELRYGSNERLRRLAQEIVVAQQQEITVMQAVVADELPATSADLTQNPWGAICTGI